MSKMLGGLFGLFFLQASMLDALELAPLFQDGAVLQQGKPVPVWGRAAPGATVSVDFSGHRGTTAADNAGRWRVTLPAMKASAEGATLKVREQDAETVEILDVLVGEVWLASGQSNMEWAISQSRREDQDAAAEGPVPLLRLFQVPRALNHARQERISNASWQPATPQTVQSFSAIGYFFGRKLTEELKVPVGIIHSSWGGSRIEPWWAEEGLEGIDDLVVTRDHRRHRSPGFPEYDKALREHIGAVRKWVSDTENALETFRPVPAMPQGPEQLKLGHNAETGTYQAMIHPLAPYALRGFLWYQGESNNGEGMAYKPKMRALIAGWRNRFENEQAPFFFVQLAPFNYGASRAHDLPGMWVAQQKALVIPGTGMVVTNDIGNVLDIHPRNKSEVARRLSLWALADAYGRADIVKSGPLYKSYKVTEQGIRIDFSHTGGGLVTRDGKAPGWFEIAGADGEYHQADARISSDGKSILLTSQAVAKPDRARFAWDQTAQPNLMNREGLPAGAFNTHWPLDPTLGRLVSKRKPHTSSHPNQSGWNNGITDGQWGNEPRTCFATDASPEFPKHVTVDLGAAQSVQAVVFGTPDIGATKSVEISLSTDGETFTNIGAYDFPAKRAARKELRFAPKEARYIRATFTGQHPTQDGYNMNHAFLSELEVYAPVPEEQ